VQLSAVQFHLITTTILFLSREGFRRGGLRIQDAASTKQVGRYGTDSTDLLAASSFYFAATMLLS
jgi:oligosaccharide translocation protein RFT1